MNSSDDDYDAEREFDDVDEDSVEAKVWQLLLLINPGDEEAKLRVRRFLNDHGKIRKLFSLVTVIFAESPFTRENGMLRPNMKIDRKRIIERYGAA